MAHGSRILREVIDVTETKLEEYTTFGLKNLMFSPPEQWISGPCGNGKMWLLVKKVRDIAEHSTDSVLVVCYGEPLSWMLAKALRYEKVKVMTFAGLLEQLCALLPTVEQEGEGLVTEALEKLKEETVQFQRYHHIFVCECEDLEGHEWPTLFKTLCKDEGQEYGDRVNHIWFLYDPNEYLFPRYINHMESLKKGTKLPSVYRTTRNISSLARKYFQASVHGTKSLEFGHPICGPRIEWDGSLTSRDVNKEAGAKILEGHILHLRRNKVANKEICILTESEMVRDTTISELRKLGIQSQNATDRYSKDEDKVVVESVRQFKNIPSNVVILYNPAYSVGRGWTKKSVKSTLYFAVSSCVCKLVVITTECGCKALQSDEGMAFHIEGSSSLQNDVPITSSFQTTCI